MSHIVRTRFAPSPTGHLHIGGARTALFNYLLAKRHGGKFILRIEDTDRTRNIEAADEKLREDLLWMGLHWDEGPEVGGEHGPYYQSARLGLYKQHARRLLDEGGADIRELNGRPDAWLLSDHVDFFPEEAALVADLPRVSVGPKVLHADHTITVVLNELDRSEC